MMCQPRERFLPGRPTLPNYYYEPLTIWEFAKGARNSSAKGLKDLESRQEREYGHGFVSDIARSASK